MLFRVLSFLLFYRSKIFFFYFNFILFDSRSDFGDFEVNRDLFNERALDSPSMLVEFDKSLEKLGSTKFPFKTWKVSGAQNYLYHSHDDVWFEKSNRKVTHKYKQLSEKNDEVILFDVVRKSYIKLNKSFIFYGDALDKVCLFNKGTWVRFWLWKAKGERKFYKLEDETNWAFYSDDIKLADLKLIESKSDEIVLQRSDKTFVKLKSDSSLKGASKSTCFETEYEGSWLVDYYDPIEKEPSTQEARHQVWKVECEDKYFKRLNGGKTWAEYLDGKRRSEFSFIELKNDCGEVLLLKNDSMYLRLDEDKAMVGWKENTPQIYVFGRWLSGDDLNEQVNFFDNKLILRALSML